MKVLWITERFAPDRGGAAVSATRQVRGLARELKRIDVLRLTDQLPPGRAGLEEHDGVRIHTVGRTRTPEESLQSLTQTALNLHAVEKYDLFQGFYAVHAGYVAAYVARLNDLPSVVSLRGNDLDRGMFHGPRLPFLEWTLRNAGALIGVSTEILRKAWALTGRTEWLHRIPNGVDTGRFRPPQDGDESPAELREAERPLIGFSGELRYKKGLPVLLDLAGALAEAKKGTLVWIGGVRGDEADEVIRWRRSFPEAAARVIEIPYTNDPDALAAFMRSLDLLVLPSLWDGLPNALLEGMSCARPVLASGVGAIPEVIDDGKTGFLLPPHRLDEFPREALRILARDPAELARIGAAAREKVRTEFTPAAEQAALLKLYRMLVP